MTGGDRFEFASGKKIGIGLIKNLIRFFIFQYKKNMEDMEVEQIILCAISPQFLLSSAPQLKPLNITQT